MKAYHFSYGNPLDPERQDKVYVVRPEDQEVRGVVEKTGVECGLALVIGARQTGKTSLINRLHKDLSLDESWLLMQIDLRTWNALQGQAWYQRLITECMQGLQPYLANVTLEALQRQCEQRSIGSLFSPHGWTELVYLACQNLPARRRLLISLDSINRMPHEEWGPLFSQIRALQEAAKSSVNSRRDVYRKFGITLSGAFDPNQLITDDNSPFNVGSRVYMSAIASAQLAQLAGLLAEQGIVLEDGAVQAIQRWTGGMPYYVQCFCAQIEELGQTPVTAAQIDNIAEDIALNDTYISFALRNLAGDTALERYARRILDRPIPSVRTMAPIAALEILGIIRYDASAKKWAIVNLFYERALRELFDTGAGAPTNALKPGALELLGKAVKFLQDDTPGLIGKWWAFDPTARPGEQPGAGAATTTAAEVLAWPPMVDNVEDLLQDISHTLGLIDIHRRNIRSLEITIANSGGLQSPATLLSTRNEYRDQLFQAAQRCQDLKALLEKMYGREIIVRAV